MRGFITIFMSIFLVHALGCSLSGGDKALLEQGGGRAEAAVNGNGSLVQRSVNLTAEGMTRFSGFSLPEVDMPYAKGQWVWAAVPMDYGFSRWTVVQAMFIEAAGGHALVSALSASLTPSAFLRPLEPALDARPGEPVLVHKGLEAAYGRVLGVADEGISVTFCTGKGVGQGTFPADHVLSLKAQSPVIGAPVEVRTSEGRVIGRYVFGTDEKVYVILPSGKLLELPSGEIEPVKLTRQLPTGAQVLVQKPGDPQAVLAPAVLTGAVPGGAAYTARMEDGESLTVPYGCVRPGGSQAAP